jgi:hypothetical protein
MEGAIREATGHNDMAYRFACKCKRCNYDLKYVIEFIFANPDVFGTSETDLLNAIKSPYHIKQF